MSKQNAFAAIRERWENGPTAAAAPVAEVAVSVGASAPPAAPAAPYAMPMGEPGRATVPAVPADNTRSGLVGIPPKNEVSAAVEAIGLDRIVDSPFQPRKRQLNKKETEDLARLIGAAGQTTPIIVTPGEGELEGKYVVHSGHRRCAAIRVLGWPTVNAIVRKDLTEREARKLALTDNLGREDLSAYEQAIAFRDYCAAYELDVAKAAEELGISRRQGGRFHAVANASEPLLQLLCDEALPFQAAEPLVRIDTRDPRAAIRLAKRFAAGAITVAGLEAEAAGSASSAPKASLAPDVYLKVTPKGIHLTVRVDHDLADEQRELVRAAVARFLGHVGIRSVVAEETAAAVGVSGDVAKAA